MILLPPGSKLEEAAVDTIFLCLHNLRGYLETGSAVIRPSYVLVNNEVSVGVTIDGEPETVFAHVVEPPLMRKWLSGGRPVVDLKVGGQYSYGWPEGMGPTTIHELKPERVLRHGWIYRHEPAGEVTWRVEATDRRTRLTLQHSGFGEGTDATLYQQGWAAFLAEIKAVVENRPQVRKTTADD